MARKLEKQDHARVEIKVTGGNLRNGHIYLAKHLDHFPSDCIGSPNARDGEGIPISLAFAGTGEQTTTDIASDKLIFRARRPWRRFYEHWKVQDGDLIAIERIGARAYNVMPCKRGTAAQARSPLDTASRPDSVRAGRSGAGRSVARRSGVASDGRAAYDTPLALDAHDAHDGALFRRFRSAMLELDAATRREAVEVEELLLYRDRSIETYYAPFDYLNPRAGLLLVGITPGAMQMTNSISALRRALAAGHADHDARGMAQRAASFSGPMRSRLEYMLDALGIPRRLGTTSAALLLTDGETIQTTSCVRYPTFRRTGARNWNGRQPLLLEHDRLREYVFKVLAAEVAALPDALVVPLGNVAGEAVNALVDAGLLHRDRCCIGVPHPSPANGSMEATFRRDRQTLASQVVRHFA